jgi:hypothetical protein
VALGQVFFEYLGFPCQFSFHQLLHTHHLSSGAGTIGQLVADVPSGLSLTPPQETKTKLLIKVYSECLCDCISREFIYVPKKEKLLGGLGKICIIMNFTTLYFLHVH